MDVDPHHGATGWRSVVTTVPLDRGARGPQTCRASRSSPSRCWPRCPTPPPWTLQLLDPVPGEPAALRAAPAKHPAQRLLLRKQRDPAVARVGHSCLAGHQISSHILLHHRSPDVVCNVPEGKGLSSRLGAGGPCRDPRTPPLHFPSWMPQMQPQSRPLWNPCQPPTPGPWPANSAAAAG